eukprot:TRINITY_DN18025_c0_g1_i4.p1 TRINITY_DN18025_c0_g1~~TRINITY_DN18025_c0_g1_i4.p1  ORF type:complete len:348 (+),score=65.48 TRINITY_DN18025_c0_g1_i4:153-1046(+)
MRPNDPASGAALLLDPQSLQLIQDYLVRSGGSASLSILSARFPGLTGAQLEGQFYLNRIGNEWDVSMLSPEEEAMMSAAGQLSIPTQQMNGMQLQTGQLAAGVPALKAPPEEEFVLLSDDILQGISQALQAAGGILPLGAICQKFPGVKRANLEGFYELSRVGNHGQWEVRLPGIQSAGAEMMVGSVPAAKDVELHPLLPEQVATITELLQGQENFTAPMYMVKRAAPDVQKSQLEPHFQVIRVDKKHYFVRLQGAPDIPIVVGKGGKNGKGGGGMKGDMDMLLAGQKRKLEGTEVD